LLGGHHEKKMKVVLYQNLIRVELDSKRFGADGRAGSVMAGGVLHPGENHRVVFGLANSISGYRTAAGKTKQPCGPAGFEASSCAQA